MPNPNPLADDDIAQLQALLDALPAPLQPLDVSALDGFLCGVLLQPRVVPASRWLTHVADLDGREAPAGAARDGLHALVLRRHAELDQAIGNRQWFDPWVFPLDDTDSGEGDHGDGGDPAASIADTVLPWSAGFAAAMELFPDLMAMDDAELVEPLALLFMHFDPEDLEDADALAAVIETLEPPTDLAEAVQDLVRALMLIADVSRPRLQAAARRPRPGARRPGGASRTPPARRPR